MADKKYPWFKSIFCKKDKEQAVKEVYAGPENFDKNDLISAVYAGPEMIDDEKEDIRFVPSTNTMTVYAGPEYFQNIPPVAVKMPPMSNDPEAVYCPKCNALLKKKFKYCIECGTLLDNKGIKDDTI